MQGLLPDYLQKQRLLRKLRREQVPDNGPASVVRVTGFAPLAAREEVRDGLRDWADPDRGAAALIMPREQPLRPAPEPQPRAQYPTATGRSISTRLRASKSVLAFESLEVSRISSQVVR